MSEQKFQVVVNGTLTKGAQLDQTKQNIAKLFKTSLDKVEPMFSGKTLAVKKGLDEATAQKYKAAIVKSGLAAGVVAMDTIAPQAQSSATATSLDAATLAATGSMMDETPPPTAPDIDTSQYVMGTVGETLAEQANVAEPDIDTSQFTMGNVGEDVTEHEEIPDADIDVSALSMGEVGEDVTEAVEVPPTNIDTSELSMGGVGEDVMEHEPVPPANIDTSELSLDEPTQ